MFQPDPYHERISVEEKIGPQDLIMASWSFATPLLKWLVCLKWIPFSLISSPKSYTLPHQHLQPFLYPKHSASKSTNESPTNGSPSRIPKRKGPELETSKRLQQQTSGLVVISYSLVIRPMTTTAATCLWNMTKIGLTTIINSSNQPLAIIKVLQKVHNKTVATCWLNDHSATSISPTSKSFLEKWPKH